MSMTTDPQMDVLGLVEQADRDMYRDKSRSVGRLARPDNGDVRPAPVPVVHPPVWSHTVQGALAAPVASWPEAPYWAIPWSSATDPVPPVGGHHAG